MFQPRLNSSAVLLNFVALTTPIQANERIEILDIVRGYALLGVLVLNTLSFSGPYLHATAWAFSDTWWDRITEFVLLVGGQSAFYSTFSFLFGVGFALQHQRSKQQSLPFTRRHMLRMGVLAVFGVVHTVLIWDGDILLVYSIAGVLLLPLQNASPKKVLSWSVGVGGILVTTLLAIGGFDAVFDSGASSDQLINANLARHQNGSYIDLTRYRLSNAGSHIAFAVPIAAWISAIFCTGVWAVRTDKVATWRNQRLFMIRVLKIATPVALIAKGSYAAMILTESPDMLRLLGPIVSLLSGPFVGAAYLCVLLLVLRRDATRLRPLASVGRMALTNYLSQSVAMVLVYDGYGFGLYGRPGLAASVGISICFFGVQILFSRWWLQRFQFGPIEWLWRRLTYHHALTVKLP